MPNIISYKLALDADTAKALKKLNDVDTKITELDNGKILVDFKYNQNMPEFNRKMKEIAALNPELGVQFQYDMNKRGYLQAKEQLESMTQIKMQVDTKGAEGYINELIADIKSLYKSGASEDALTAPIQNLLNITKTIDKSQLSKIDIELGDIYDKYDKLYDLKPQQLFDLSDIDKVRQDVDGFESAMKALKKQGAVDIVETSDDKEIAELTERVSILEDRLSSLQSGMSSLNGDGFLNVADSAEILKQKLADTLSLLNEIGQKKIDTDNVVTHIGNITKIGSSDYIRSDNLGRLPELLQNNMGHGSGWFFSTPIASDVAEKGQGSMTNGFKGMKTYIVDLNETKEALHQLKYETEEAEADGINTLKAINAFVFKMSAGMEELEKLGVDTQSNYGFKIFDTIEELYNHTKATLPDMNLTLDEFISLLEQEKQKLDALGTIDYDTGLYKNADKLGNDLLPSDQLLKRIGYTGFTPISDSAYDGSGVGGWIIEPEKYLSSLETSKEYLKSFTEEESQAARDFLDNIDTFFNQINQGVERTAQRAVELRENVIQIIHSVEELKKAVGMSSSNSSDVLSEVEDIQSVEDEAAKMTNAAKASVQKTQDSNSSSIVGRELGNDFAQGYALGIGDVIPQVGQVAADLSAAALTAIREDDSNYRLAGSIQGHYYSDGLQDALNDISLDATHLNRQVSSAAFDPDQMANNQDEELKELNTLVISIETAIQEQIKAFNTSDQVVSAVVKSEIDQLTLLLDIIQRISKALQDIQMPQGDKIAWIDSFKKLDPDNVTAIANALKVLYQSISGLNVKDSNIVSSINNILNKGKELENLAKVLSSSKKDIEAAKEATISKKDKDTKASYQKELSLRKEQLKLEHEINVAQAKGADNADEIAAKNKPIISLLEQQIEAEKQRKNTSREYRKEINAEISAIEKRNKAEVEGIKAATGIHRQRNSEALVQKQLQSYVSTLSGWKDKIQNTVDFKADKLMSDYVSNLEAQIVKLHDKIEALNSNQIDITDPKEQKELEDLVKESKNLQTNLQKAAKDISIKSLDNQMADYLSKNTKLSKELRGEIENLRRKLNNGDLSPSDVSKLAADFEEVKAKAKDAGQEGKTFFDQMRQRMTDMNTKFIAQFLSWQDLIRYIRQAAQTVTELDSALTELRKVSDASTERLNQSFEESAQTAQELGASISDVINMTADWARLNKLGLLYGNV